ncbi:hypothetical protein SDC9_94358 [bioreactor metagenome]|uniref:Uncharacterized protein n=1 Tax=bioreactor metagenome TaxID=1076179 RepID=A0A645A3J4_9ZZZZ|nr:hypothetical protein [Erysipelotrichaceae bacterium]
MASIVYLTDRKMIEYHRLNGSRTMNFWRPTSSRRILEFHQGDLLFFLSKGTERGITKEKGIVGYGRYQKSHSLPFKQMWKVYGTQNGYDQESELYDAIIKVSKNKQMPKSLSCLYLADIVYFQAPIYLSEIGVKISNMIESYFYLDKDDSLATAKILNKAKDVGVDRWSAVINDQDMGVMTFEIDYCKHIIAEAIDRLGNIYSETEIKRAYKVCQIMMTEMTEQGINVEMIKGSHSTFAVISNKKAEIYLPLVAAAKDLINKIQLLIGHITIMQAIINKKVTDYQLVVTIVVDAHLPAEYLELFKLAHVNYQIITDQTKIQEQIKE